jgi:hypothetical protein
MCGFDCQWARRGSIDTSLEEENETHVLRRLAVDEVNGIHVNRASTMRESFNRKSGVCFVADHSQYTCVP